MPPESPPLEDLGQDLEATERVWRQDGYTIEKVLPPAGSGYLFGSNVATDGVVIVVGVPNTWGSGPRTGAVYLFEPTRSGWDWHSIRASDGEPGDDFGSSVAVENGVVVVGAPGFADEETGLPNTPGAVYVYRKDGDDWVEEKLAPSEAAPGDGVGTSVAISANRVFAGALRDTHAGDYSGALYIFEQTEDGWGEQRVVASDAHAHHWFGWRLAADGDRVVVGTAEGNGCCLPGTAYVYEYVEGRWVETALTAEVDQFGNRVSISGSLVLVGTARYGDQDQGAAFLFDLEAGTVEEYHPEGSTRDSYFGRSVVLTKDWLAIGAVNNADAADSAGVVYVYTRANEAWLPVRVPPPDDESFSGGLAAGGDVLVVGASGDTEGGAGAGAIYIVRLNR
jgi:hypothetical protein